jgi:hypothetical protein
MPSSSEYRMFTTISWSAAVKVASVAVAVELSSLAACQFGYC